MKILCYLVLVFTGWTLAAVQPKSVNLALETVLQFDKKNHVADLEVITRVQKFLDNIKDVMSVYDGSKPSRRSNDESLKFTDFILQVVNIVRSYNDSDLKQVVTVLDDESRKYNYKGSKFHELLDNGSMRRFMSRNLEDAKEIPIEKLRSLLDVVATGIKNQKLQKDEKKLLSLVNSLYSGSEARFTEVLSNLSNYGTRRFNLSPNLRDIVSKGLKTVVFDFYSNLNPNARMSLKSAVHKYWRQYLGGKDRPSNVASTKREEKPKSNFIDLIDVTRYYNNDMHKWSARAKRTKHIMTTPSPRMTKSLNKKSNPHKQDAMGLSLDLNSLKPVFQSFFKKFTENKKKDNADIIPIKDNKTKTKHKNVEQSKQDAFESFMQATPTPESFEASDRDAVREKPRTAMIPQDEYQATTTKKKRGRTPRNKDQISFDDFLKSKSEIRSEIRDLNEIQKKYDKLRKLQSNLSPEVKSDKEDKQLTEENTSDGDGFEFLIGGQKIQDAQSKTKHKRIHSKKTPERENEANIVSDHQAVIEVTESEELKPKKRLRTPHKTAKKPKKHRKPYRGQTSMFNLRSGKKTRRPSSMKPAHASNEGMSIESYEKELRNTHLGIRRIKEGETVSVIENFNPRAAKDSNVVSILHKLEKELENVKAKIKYDASHNTHKAVVTSESHSIEAITDTVPTGDGLVYWSEAKTPKTKTIIATTSKVVSQDKHSGRRDRLQEHSSKHLRDTLFRSNNVTYNSKYISPLQVLLNQTMARISSYINETISTNKNNNNAKDIDFDTSDDSNERTESVTTSTVTKVSKTKQESFEKVHNTRKSKEIQRGPLSWEEGEKKTLSKEKVRKGSQTLEEGEKKTLSKEKVRKASQSLAEGEKKTLSKEKVRKGSQSLEKVEKKTLPKGKVHKGSQSSEEGEIKTLSKEKVHKASQSLEEGEKKTLSKEKLNKRSRSLEEGEKKTLSKQKVRKGSQSLEEGEQKTLSKEKVHKGSRSLEKGDKKTLSKEKVRIRSQYLDGAEKIILSKEKVSKGAQSLEDEEKITVSKENVQNSQPLEKGKKITASKEKVENASQSLEERENSTVSREKAKTGTQSVKEIEKITMSKEKVGKGSHSLVEGEHRTVPKEKVKKAPSSKKDKTRVSKEKVKKVLSWEEGEKVTVSEENIGDPLLLLKDKNDTKSHDNEGQPDRSKTETTPTKDNVSFSTSIMNNLYKIKNEDARKFSGILKDDSRRNNKGMIPPELDLPGNYLLDENIFKDTLY